MFIPTNKEIHQLQQRLRVNATQNGESLYNCYAHVISKKNI